MYFMIKQGIKSQNNKKRTQFTLSSFFINILIVINPNLQVSKSTLY